MAVCRSRRWGVLWIQCRVKSQEDGEKLEVHQDQNRCDTEELRERVFESCRVVCRASSLFLALLSQCDTARSNFCKEPWFRSVFRNKLRVVWKMGAELAQQVLLFSGQNCETALKFTNAPVISSFHSVAVLHLCSSLQVCISLLYDEMSTSPTHSSKYISFPLPDNKMISKPIHERCQQQARTL